MADELHTPSHRLYQRAFNIRLSREDFSRDTIFDAAIIKIDAFISGGAYVTATAGTFSISVTSNSSSAPLASAYGSTIRITG